ncbi:MAG: YqzL family protein [Clostridia bacterium]|nr:YqzL family protein [Clostridia bacterium]
MKEEEQGKTAREIAWQLFEQTGNFSYYMLYKRLK